MATRINSGPNMTALASTALTGNSTTGKAFFCRIELASIRLFAPLDIASQNAIHGKDPTIKNAPTARTGASVPSRMANTISSTS